MTKHVAVLGAGAMGSLFGGLLAEGGLEVTLVDPWKEHIDSIRQNGLQIVGLGGDRFIPIGATTDAAEVESADLVFVQCKANFNAVAAKSMQHLFTDASSTVAISFQNGLGNEEELANYFGEGRVLGGLTAQGANVEGPGVIRNHAELPSYIGEMSVRPGLEVRLALPDRVRGVQGGLLIHGSLQKVEVPEAGHAVELRVAILPELLEHGLPAESDAKTVHGDVHGDLLVDLIRGCRGTEGELRQQ